MEGTDVETGNIDNNKDHDHTYFGNGCPGLSTDGGSRLSCDTRIVTTDNEDQLIGVYYNFQAATSGTGGAIKTDNTITPDTFCPLGWQMPYGGTGGNYYDKSKSWRYLLTQYNIDHDDGDGTSSLKMKKYPITNARSGDYLWSNGRLYRKGQVARLWSSTLTNDENTAYWLNDWSGGLALYSAQYKQEGSAIRCDFDINNLKSSTWHPRSLISIMAFHFLKAHFPSVKIMS